MKSLAPIVPRPAFVKTPRLKLEYLEWGQGSEVVVCLHGTSMHAHAWTRFGNDLAAEYRVIAVNMRGHGDSDRPEQGYRIEDYRDDIESFLDAMNIETCYLTGSSLGTQVAIAVAAALPTRIRGLLLSDPSCTIIQSSIDRYTSLHRSRPRRFSTLEEVHAYSRSLPQRSRFDENMHSMTIAGDVRQTAEGEWEWRYDLQAILSTFEGLTVDQWPDIRAVACPVLILRGEDSHVLSRENMAKLATTFRRARAIEVPDCSHTIWGDKPDLLGQLGRAFFGFQSGPEAGPRT